MNEIEIISWLLWLYGFTMSFTLLRMSKVGWWGVLTSYIPWAIVIIVRWVV